MTDRNQRTSDIAITGLGMVSPVGLDTSQACSSMRAGISRFQESPDYYCLAADMDLAEPEPLVCARVPGMDPPPGPDRMAVLAAMAMSDLIRDAKLKRAHLPNLAVYLVLPRPERQTGRAMDIFGQLETHTGIAYRSGNRIFDTGRTGWFEAVSAARAEISEAGERRIALLAVDSLLDNATLRDLDHSGRLKSERNLDGFIPSEGAAAMLLEHIESAQARGVDIRALVEGIGLAEEPHPGGTFPGSPGVAADAPRGVCTPVTALPTPYRPA